MMAVTYSQRQGCIQRFGEAYAWPGWDFALVEPVEVEGLATPIWRLSGHDAREDRRYFVSFQDAIQALWVLGPPRERA